MAFVAAAVASRDWGAALKDVDRQIESCADNDGLKAQLLCNRAFCFTQLDLKRKAIKARDMVVLPKYRSFLSARDQLEAPMWQVSPMLWGHLYTDAHKFHL